MVATVFQLVFVLCCCGTGMTVARHMKLSHIDRVLVSFLLGSIVVVAYLFALMETMHIYLGWIYLLLAISGVLTIFNAHLLWRGIVGLTHVINNYLFKHDRWRNAFIVAFFCAMIWLWMMSLTPPRAADAMLYHLAQLKLIAQDHGYRFYPYITYHLPLFFGLLSLPGFMLFSGVAYKVNVFITFCISIMIALRIASLYKIKSSRALFFILFFTPLCFHDAHSALNDWPVICFGLLGYYFLFVFSEVLEAKYLYVAFAALGFGLGIKYQSILYLPGAAFFTLYVLIANKQYHLLKHVVGSGIVMLLVASPFYIKNWIYFHNPVWPLAVNVFHAKASYLNELALKFSKANSGQHNIASLFNNLRNFIRYPLIPASIWGCIFLSAILAFRQQFKLVVVLILYFLTWWLFQPNYYLRFGIFILPLGLLICFRCYEESSLKIINKYIMRPGYAITMLFSVPLFFYYSIFYAKFYVNRDLAQYHKGTLYYSDLQWINHHTLKNAKIMPILLSGQTYYLDRPYLRGDPLSAAINWPAIQSNRDLYNVLHKEKIRYIFSGMGNKRVKSFMHSQYARVVYHHVTPLERSRLFGDVNYQPVYLIRIKS